jgi:hypothetical protein
MSFLLASTSGDNSTLAGDALEEDAACDTPSHSINSIGELFRVVSMEGYAALPINTSVDPFNPTGERTKAYIVALESFDMVDVDFRIIIVCVLGPKLNPFPNYWCLCAVANGECYDICCAKPPYDIIMTRPLGRKVVMSSRHLLTNP